MVQIRNVARFMKKSMGTVVLTLILGVLIGATVSESDILEFQANIRAEISARQDADTADPAP